MAQSTTRLGIRNRSTDRRSMIDRAILLVEGSAARGDAFSIDAATENLLYQYPACGMTFAELRADVATVAERGSSASPFGWR